MNSKQNSVVLTLTLIFIAFLSAVYLFIAISIIPFWQTLNGIEIQTWFADHFGRFPVMMIPVHILCIVLVITGYTLHRKHKTDMPALWLLTLISLVLCEATTPIFFVTANASLSSAVLPAAEGLQMLDDWSWWHNIRTFFVFITLICLGVINNKQLARPVSLTDESVSSLAK